MEQWRCRIDRVSLWIKQGRAAIAWEIEASFEDEEAGQTGIRPEWAFKINTKTENDTFWIIFKKPYFSEKI